MWERGLGLRVKWAFCWFFPVVALALGCGTSAEEAPQTAEVQQALPALNPLGRKYTIGAWYFTAWSRVNEFHPYWARYNAPLVQRWDPWGGVRDANQNPALVPFNQDNSFVPRVPAIGYYDLLDQRVMDKHIRQAASRGLSYFAFYWYWDPAAQAEAQVSTPIHRFLSSPEKSLMKFMIAPMRTGSAPTSLASFRERMVPFIVDRFFADSSYLVTSDGRPVIVDWDSGLDTDPAVRLQGLNYLRAYTFAKLGKYPLVLGLKDGWYNSEQEGVTCFQMGFTPKDKLAGTQQTSMDYAQMMTGWPGTFMNGIASDKVTLPCTTVGLEPRPWCLNQPWLCPPGEPLYNYYNTGMTPSAFRTHLGNVKSFLDTHSTTLNALTIYAWNEWGEGGVIEPSANFGTQYLDAIRDVFQLDSTPANTPNVDLSATFVEPRNKHAIFVQQAFQKLLGRTASNSDLDSFANITLDKLAFIEAVASSPEYASKWSARLGTPSAQVGLLFEQLVARTPSQAELNLYTPIVAGYGRTMLLHALLYSPEHFNKDPILSPTRGTTTLAQGLYQVYRLRNGPDYFFTAGVDEMDAARLGGWIFEGAAWKVFGAAGTGRAPLHRCRNTPWHFLSMDPACENWPVEGVLGYGTGAVSGSAQLIRFFSPGTGTHIALLSTDTAEINAMPAHGFVNEGTLVSLPSW